MKKIIIYTIGHSTHSLEQFLELLRENSVNQLIDIRTIPQSRHNPQFNKLALAQFLRNHRINYRHMKHLGGLRKAKKDSLNTGWENASFRGFADYMQTNQFKQAIKNLETIANKKIVAIMCAEAVPWRCHRSLIADALTIDGYAVKHIVSKSAPKYHKLTSFLKQKGGKLIYQ